MAGRNASRFARNWQVEPGSAAACPENSAQKCSERKMQARQYKHRDANNDRCIAVQRRSRHDRLQVMPLASTSRQDAMGAESAAITSQVMNQSQSDDHNAPTTTSQSQRSGHKIGHRPPSHPRVITANHRAHSQETPVTDPPRVADDRGASPQQLALAARAVVARRVGEFLMRSSDISGMRTPCSPRRSCAGCIRSASHR